MLFDLDYILCYIVMINVIYLIYIMLYYYIRNPKIRGYTNRKSNDLYFTKM